MIWNTRTADLIGQALGDGHWASAFASAGAATMGEMLSTTRGAVQAEDRVRAARVRRQVPMIDEVLEQIDRLAASWASRRSPC